MVGVWQPLLFDQLRPGVHFGLNGVLLRAVLMLVMPVMRMVSMVELFIMMSVLQNSSVIHVDVMLRGHLSTVSMVPGFTLFVVCVRHRRVMRVVRLRIVAVVNVGLMMRVIQLLRMVGVLNSRTVREVHMMLR